MNPSPSTQRSSDTAPELLTIHHSTSFHEVSAPQLDTMADAELDVLPYGVIGLDPSGDSVIYNATESRYAGIPRTAVLGRPFFLAVGVCMNNFMVAQRLEDEVELDVTLDYVLTLRMRPTPVQLRLLRSAAAQRRFILLLRR